MEISVKDVKELMDSVSKNKLSGLELKCGDIELRIGGMNTGRIIAAPELQAAYASDQLDAEEELRGNVVKSPIVGTFYEAPAPDKEPYVSVGSQVNKGDVLFIIESMKLMNEVTSDFSGTVAEIIAANGQGVEYGQPILRIE